MSRTALKQLVVEFESCMAFMVVGRFDTIHKQDVSFRLETGSSF